MDKVWSVWCGGIEINDYYLTFDEATSLFYVWRNKGFDDVYLSREVMAAT